MTALRPARMNVPGNKTFKMRTLSAVIMGLCVGGQAFAETNNNNDAAAQDGTISVITVIGEKTERSIYDTGSSVEVYDEDRINTTPGASEVDDLLQLTPNIVDSGHGNSIPTVRGIDGSGPTVGGAASFAGTSPRLNLSIDGRSLTYSEIAFGPRSLWDMQQVEIYLGPQSYVQGKSASAGAIVMKSKDPTYHFESAVKGAIAEQNYTQTAAMISAPIIEDELAFRLSVDQQKRKSHVDLATYDPAGDANRIEMTSVRGKFLYEPSALPGFKTTLAIAHMSSRSPQSENENGSTYTKYRPTYTTDSTSTSWDIVWELTDTITFENNLVYSKFGYDRFTQPSVKADFTTDGTDFHIEPMIKYSSLDDKLNGLVGLRYYRSSLDDIFTTYSPRAKKDFVYPMEGGTDTQSAFAEVTYSVQPDIDLILAGRFEKERVKRKVEFIKLDYDESLSVFLPKAEIAYKPYANQTIGFRVGKGYNSGGAGLALHEDTSAKKPKIGYTFDEEYIWNYEFYTRHSLNENKLVLTSNVFYNDFKDMQIQQTRADGYVFVENIDSAKTYGAEIGTRWLATMDLEVFANMGLLKAEFTETAEQGGAKRKLPRSPALSGSLGALYTFANDFELSGNATYTGAYYSERKNDEAQKVSPYWVANAQLSYLFDNGRASLFVSNLFDSRESTFYSFNSLDDPIKQQPRQIGASVELNF